MKPYLSYVISLFFQLVLHLTAYEAVLGLCPMAIGIVISSMVCRLLLNKLGRKLVVIGLSTTLVGALGLWATVFVKGTADNRMADGSRYPDYWRRHGRLFQQYL